MTHESNMQSLPPVRRVVTGHDIHKVARTIIDGDATNAKFVHGIRSTLIWVTDSTPCDIAIGMEVEDWGARKLGTAPPANGSRFCVIDFPPGGPSLMHRTETLDYVVVMSGEIDMDMDASSVRLREGDVLVQRGTNHAWVNRGAELARVAFVLLDAVPIGIGAAVLGQATAGNDLPPER
ncbi:MAG: cupin 2 protein [Ramlibacter sp.]|nr:cupin 2 protein [Ramlibacter sp.]